MKVFKNKDEVKKQNDKQERMNELADKLTLENLMTTMKRHHATRKYWMITIIGLIVMTALCILADFVMPMKGAAWNIIRSFIAMGAGVFDFMLAYTLAVYQSVANERHYDDDVPIDEVVDPYMPFRLRFSVKQRRRQSYPFMAVLVVIAIASAYSHLYTLLGGVVVAGVFAIISYVRPTPDELILIENDMPDTRDILDIAQEVEREETARKAKLKAKAIQKAKKELKNNKNTDRL